MAADPIAPNKVYAYVFEDGLFASTDWGQSWSPVPINLDSNAVTSISLDTYAASVLIAAGEQGLFGSADSGLTWDRLDGHDGLPTGEFWAVRFDPAGVAYVGGKGGIYRAQAVHSWIWERVINVPTVFHFDLGSTGAIFLVTGLERANTIACWSPADGLNVARIYENDDVIAVSADPRNSDRFYIGRLFGTENMRCTGGREPVWVTAKSVLAYLAGRLGRDPGVGGFAVFEREDGSSVLLRASGGGLYIPVDALQSGRKDP